jgi:very-short-patch-repair endonuclease
MTLPEKLLWKKVRRNSLEGFHFRRQQIIAGFVVDFYCHEARLAIEIDGRVHDAQKEYDAVRDQAIAAYDVSILRFKNESVTESLDLVLEQILLACKTRTHKATR